MRIVLVEQVVVVVERQQVFADAIPGIFIRHGIERNGKRVNNLAGRICITTRVHVRFDVENCVTVDIKAIFAIFLNFARLGRVRSSNGSRRRCRSRWIPANTIKDVVLNRRVERIQHSHCVIRHVMARAPQNLHVSRLVSQSKAHLPLIGDLLIRPPEIRHRRSRVERFRTAVNLNVLHGDVFSSSKIHRHGACKLNLWILSGGARASRDLNRRLLGPLRDDFRANKRIIRVPPTLHAQHIPRLQHQLRGFERTKRIRRGPGVFIRRVGDPSRGHVKITLGFLRLSKQWHLRSLAVQHLRCRHRRGRRVRVSMTHRRRRRRRRRRGARDPRERRHRARRRRSRRSRRRTPRARHRTPTIIRRHRARRRHQRLPSTTANATREASRSASFNTKPRDSRMRSVCARASSSSRTANGCGRGGYARGAEMCGAREGGAARESTRSRRVVLGRWMGGAFGCWGVTPLM